MPPARLRTGVRAAAAFAPAHITGVFAPDVSARDPRARGSVGAGIVLDAGVSAYARFRPGPRRSVTVTSGRVRRLPISLEVATRLMGRRTGSLRVDLHHDIPIAQGFGASAAGALATGLAVGRLFGHSRQRSIEVAHLADLFLGGGLGGVAAILGGGLEVRTRTGVPPWGRIRHQPFERRLVLLTPGAPLPSPRLLLDPRFLRRVQRAAETGLGLLGTRPGPGEFLAAAESFTDDLRLGPPSLLRLIRRVRSEGCWAAQTMFGTSLYAVPKGPGARRRLVGLLEHRRLPAVELGAARRGARALRAPRESLLLGGRVGADP